MQYKNYPKIFQWIFSFCFFIYALFKFDVFYFLSGETLLTRKLRKMELRTYKFFKKKIIMHFVGADIRSVEYVKRKEKNIKSYLEDKWSYSKSELWQRKLLLDAEKYANEIIVSTPDLLSLIKKAKYYPVLIDIEKFNDEIKKITEINNNNKITILHAPSNIEMKGTQIIEKVLKRIIENTNLDIELILPYVNKKGESVYSVSRYDLFKMYLEADIVIDQMIIGWYGLQAIEALLTKNIVISYVDENLKKYLYKDCPIKIADVNTLEKVILESIAKVKSNDYNQSINWVQKYHAIENNEFLIETLI